MNKGRILRIRLGHNPTSSAVTYQLLPAASGGMLAVTLAVISLAGFRGLPVLWRIWRGGIHPDDSSSIGISIAAVRSAYRLKWKLFWFALKATALYFPIIFVSSSLVLDPIMRHGLRYGAWQGISILTFYSLFIAIVASKLVVSALGNASRSGGKLRLLSSMRDNWVLLNVAALLTPVVAVVPIVLSLLEGVVVKDLGVTYGRVPKLATPSFGLKSWIIFAVILAALALMFWIWKNILAHGAAEVRLLQPDEKAIPTRRPTTLSYRPMFVCLLVILIPVVLVVGLTGLVRGTANYAYLGRLYSRSHVAVLMFVCVFVISVASTIPAMAVLIRTGADPNLAAEDPVQ